MDQRKLQKDTPALPSKEAPLLNLKPPQNVKDLSIHKTVPTNLEFQNLETRTRHTEQNRVGESDPLKDLNNAKTLQLEGVKNNSAEDTPRSTVKVNLRERHTSLAARPLSLHCEVDLKENVPRLYRWASERGSLTKQSSKGTTRPLSLSKLEEFDSTNTENESTRAWKEDTGSFQVVHSKAPTASKLIRGPSYQSMDHLTRPDIEKFVKSVASTGRVDAGEWHRLEHAPVLSASCSNIPETEEIRHPNTAFSESSISKLSDPREPFEEIYGTKPILSVSMTSKEYKDITIKGGANRKEISQDCVKSTVLYEVFETIVPNGGDKSIDERVCSSVENIEELSKQDCSLLLKCQPGETKDVVNNVITDFSEEFNAPANSDFVADDKDYSNFPPDAFLNLTASNNCSANILREVIELVKTALPENDISKVSLKQENRANQNTPSTPELFAALKWILHKLPDEEKDDSGNSVFNCLGKLASLIGDDDNVNSLKDSAEVPKYTTSVTDPIIDLNIGAEPKRQGQFRDDKESHYGVDSDAECQINNEVEHTFQQRLGAQENIIHVDETLQNPFNLIENCEPSGLDTNPADLDDRKQLKITYVDQECHCETQQHDSIDNSVIEFLKHADNILKKPCDVIQPIDQKSVDSNIDRRIKDNPAINVTRLGSTNHCNNNHESNRREMDAEKQVRENEKSFSEYKSKSISKLNNERINDDVIPVIVESDDNENDTIDVTGLTCNRRVNHKHAYQEYLDRHANEEENSTYKCVTGKSETFWGSQPYLNRSIGVNYSRQQTLNSQEQYNRTRDNVEQQFSDHDYRDGARNARVSMNNNSFSNNFVSQDGSNSGHQYYLRSQNSLRNQQQEEFVIRLRKQCQNTIPVDKSFDTQYTQDTTLSSESQTNDVSISDSLQRHFTTNNDNNKLKSPYVLAGNRGHHGHSTVGNSLKGSLSDSSSLTSESSFKTDATQTDSCSASVDYSYEIEKLRAERQRVYDILTRYDYGHSRERVQAAEAKLNYGIGQMDTLLGYLELEPVKTSRVYTDHGLREVAPKETISHPRTTTTTTAASTRRSSNDIIQNQNDYFRRLGLSDQIKTGASKASSRASVVLGFDRRHNYDIRSDNVTESGRHDFINRYSDAFRSSLPVVTSSSHRENIRSTFIRNN